MKKSCRLCWLVSLVLVAVLGIGAYNFMVVGQTESYQDGRTTVLLTPSERNKVLGEMRVLLETVQAVTEQIAAGDMVAIETSARAVGMGATKGDSLTIMAKLPIEFKKLGLATHASFDDLADLAATSPDPMILLENLGQALLNCTACHQAYRFPTDSEAAN